MKCYSCDKPMIAGFDDPPMYVAALRGWLCNDCYYQSGGDIDAVEARTQNKQRLADIKGYARAQKGGGSQ